jgi:hypothetical protein
MPIPSEEGAAIVVRSGQLEKRNCEIVNRASASEDVYFGLVWPAVAY